MIAVAFLAQTAAVEKYGLGRLVGDCIEVPVIRREKPRPPENVARPDCLDPQWRAGAECFQADGDINDQGEAIRRLAGFDDHFPSDETGWHRAICQYLPMPFAQSPEERVIGQ